jgi:hypothetical protein
MQAKGARQKQREEGSMKRAILLLTAGLAILVGVALAQRQTAPATKEGAVVEFTDKTKLAGETLLGKYYFEHDDERMARGEACMYVFTYDGCKPGKQVASFHCTPVERPTARELVVSVAMSSSPDLFLLQEIQFKGSTKGHLVPAS